MKLLGMIGGTSWHSTVAYYRQINEKVGAIIGTQANPPLLLYSLNIELMRSQDWEKINTTYLEIALKLQNAGAEAILICANTPHKVYDFVQPQLDIPILHIADPVGKDAQKKGLRTLGLLGNKPTMTGGFLQTRLTEQYGIDTIIPDEEAIETSHHFVSRELTQGKFTEEAKSFYLHQMQLLKERGAEGIILGCTELPLLLTQEDIALPLLATTELHIAMAIQFILGEDRPTKGYFNP